MNAKDYLKRIARAEANIRAKKERLAVMREMTQSIGSPEMSDMPKNPNHGASRLEDSVIRMLTLESEIRRDEEALCADKTKALELIGRIANPEYQTVLISRYFRSESWEDIAKEMYYSISWIYRLHGYALEELNGILARECS